MKQQVKSVLLFLDQEQQKLQGLDGKDYFSELAWFFA